MMPINTFKPLLIGVLMCTSSAFACDSATTINALETAISEKLLQNAPTFRHGWEDKTISLSLRDAQTTANGCQATLKITVPQVDIDEVNAELDAQPYKRILLGAQGYRIPEQTSSQVDFYYLIDNGKVIQKNDANTPLKSLYSSIEYMYQSLAQSRIVLKDDTKNTIPWTVAEQESSNAACKTAFQLKQAGTASIDAACACRTQKLSDILSGRQMELVGFVQNQAYSAATGVLKSFINASLPINDSCGLVNQ